MFCIPVTGVKTISFLISIYRIFSNRSRPQIQAAVQIQKIVDRRQSQIEDKFPSNDIWRINYRAGTTLEGPGLLQKIP